MSGPRDTAGNQTCDPTGLTFAYDTENHHTDYNCGRRPVNYSYDREGDGCAKCSMIRIAVHAPSLYNKTSCLGDHWLLIRNSAPEASYGRNH
jgi:hypothetical protein